jgi:cob(I)alamin adenosyltransferase
MEQSLEPLRNFIISGGSQTASFIHLARTVCRRVERNLVATMAAVSGSVVKEKLLNLGEWLNELSNWLFVLARYANWVEGRADINVNG